MPASPEDVTEVLRGIDDPELHRSIVDLGMVTDVTVDGAAVTVDIALTIPGCPLKDYFHREVPARVRAAFPEVTDVHVRLGQMDDEQRARVVGGVRVEIPPVGQSGSRTRVVAVGSGKGGVGKSTVAVNLAAALAAEGHRVGLLDADVWGFSVPRMTGANGRPTVVEGLIMPPQVHGLAVLSIGNFVSDDDAVVWRGPMLHKTVQQLLTDVHWDDCDYLVVDMPPGTGDVAISLSQMLPGASCCLVTTPQDVASRVAQRAGSMMKRSGMHLLGVVENMSGLECGCGTVHDVFGAGGGAELAERLDVPLLGSIPLDAGVRAGADDGTPVVLARPGSAGAQRFRELAGQLAAAVGATRRHLPLLTT